MPARVTDGVHRIDCGNVNAYLVETEEGPVLVDAGMPGDVERIREAITSTGADPADLHAVLVTHTDLDHVGGLAALTAGTDARIHLSQTAAELLTGERKPPWLSTKGLFQRATNPWLDPPPPERFEIVEDGDRVGGFAVVATPGHALGHLSFVDIDRRTCFIGDMVRTEGGIRFPPSVINYDGGQLRASLAHLLETAPGFEIVCAGHGPPVVEDGYARLKRLLG